MCINCFKLTHQLDTCYKNVFFSLLFIKGNMSKDNVSVTVDLIFLQCSLAPPWYQWKWGKVYICITFCHSNIHNLQRNLDKFKPCLLVLEAVLDCQNSTKHVLSPSSCLLTPLLKLFQKARTPNHGWYLMVSIQNQTSVFLNARMKACTKVYILNQKASLKSTQPLKPWCGEAFSQFMQNRANESILTKH